MRIISGSRRGKRLLWKTDAATRPTKDRVRESVFDVLAGKIDLNGVRVLDLFAGCGAYGLESYSRGAGAVVLNDFDKEAYEIIKKNCRSIECNATVLNLDFREALSRLKSRKFDLIFLDPPYKTSFIETSIEIIQKQGNLAPDGVIVAETERELDLPFAIFKKYGRSMVYIVKLLEKNSTQN